MRIALDRLLRLVHRLNPVDRQLMLLYLEDLDGASIAEITGFSPRERASSDPPDQSAPGSPLS
jgi:RNA polymerase sigma-70 factor, ECF subfamily